MEFLDVLLEEVPSFLELDVVQTYSTIKYHLPNRVIKI